MAPKKGKHPKKTAKGSATSKATLGAGADETQHDFVGEASGLAISKSTAPLTKNSRKNRLSGDVDGETKSDVEAQEREIEAWFERELGLGASCRNEIDGIEREIGKMIDSFNHSLTITSEKTPPPNEITDQIQQLVDKASDYVSNLRSIVETFLPMVQSSGIKQNEAEDTLPDIHNISLTHLALIVKLFDETIESGKMRLESLKSILDVNQSLEDVSEKSTPRDSEKRENDHIDPADLEIGKFMEIIDDKVLDYLARHVLNKLKLGASPSSINVPTTPKKTWKPKRKSKKNKKGKKR